MRSLGLLLAVLSLAPPLRAAPGLAVLTLVDDPGRNEMDFTAALETLDDIQVSTLSGTITALLEIDLDTGEVSEFSILDSAIGGTDMSFNATSASIGSRPGWLASWK